MGWSQSVLLGALMADFGVVPQLKNLFLHELVEAGSALFPHVVPMLHLTFHVIDDEVLFDNLCVGFGDVLLYALVVRDDLVEVVLLLNRIHPLKRIDRASPPIINLFLEIGPINILMLVLDIPHKLRAQLGHPVIGQLASQFILLAPLFLVEVAEIVVEVGLGHLQ